jgi:hypothetical protein
MKKIKVNKDEVWLKGYRAGYKDALGDAYCGMVDGLKPLKQYLKGRAVSVKIKK